MNGRIGIARRIHTLTEFVKGSQWGVAPCGFAGRTQITKEKVTCSACRGFDVTNYTKEKPMGLDVAGIRKEQEAARSGGDRFKFKAGKNYIRIFLFDHEVTEADVKAGVSIESNIGNTVQKPGRAVTIQFPASKGRPVISNAGTRKQYEALEQSTDKEDQKLAQRIRPQKKFACWFVDTSVKPSRLQCQMLPISVGNEVWAKAMDEDYGAKIFGAKGRDFVVKVDKEAGNKNPNDYYKVEMRDKENCAALPSSLQEKVKDLYGEGWEALLGLGPKKASPKEEVEETTEEAEEAETEEETTEAETEETTEEAEEAETEEPSEEEAPEPDEEPPPPPNRHMLFHHYLPLARLAAKKPVKKGKK